MTRPFISTRGAPARRPGAVHAGHAWPMPHCAPAARRYFRARALTCALALAATLLAACGTAPTTPTSALTPMGTDGAPSMASCLETATQPPLPRALRMAATAQQELALWGSPTLDAEGRLTQSGPSEAEDQPRNGPGALAPWQRVLRYWRGVDPASARLPYLVRYGAWRPADRGRLQADLTQAATARTQAQAFGGGQGAGEASAAGEGMERGEGLSLSAIDALRTAVDRVAVVDTPWSAAFISWLAREAGLADDEFTFSEAHADYARVGYITRAREAASVPDERQALRACALVRTPPRVGDLVCHARGRASDLDSFDALGAELTANPQGATGVPMHCDIVVAVDNTGFDAVGGNVLQAVTRRRLAFAAGTRLLDASYQPGACASGGARGSSGSTACVHRHMSEAAWTLLLQWR